MEIMCLVVCNTSVCSFVCPFGCVFGPVFSWSTAHCGISLYVFSQGAFADSLGPTGFNVANNYFCHVRLQYMVEWFSIQSQAIFNSMGAVK